MRITIAVITAFVALSAAAAERPLSAVEYGLAPFTQSHANVASDGDGYLAVWVDTRASKTEVWGTRVARDGRALDPVGIFIGADMLPGTAPLVIWTGTSYLVVWQIGNPGAMWARRIDRDGALLGDAQLLLPQASPSSIASDGSRVAIGYTGSGAHVLIVTPDAVTVNDVLLTANGSAPALAWNGSHFAAVWTNHSHEPPSVEAIRFDTSGTLDSAPRVLPADTFPYWLKLATDGNAFVLLSRTNNVSYLPGSYGARSLSADLTTARPITTLPASFGEASSILWLGAEYAVFGERGSAAPYAMTALRLDRAAQLVETNPVVIENLAFNGSAPAAATNGHDVLVAWNGAFLTTPKDAGVDIYGTLLHPSTLQAETRAQLSASAKKQSAPAMASDGTNALAVWSEDTGVYAKRLALDGSPIDAQPLRLYDQPAAASVVFNGTGYIVAWFDVAKHFVETRRVARAGALRADGGGSVQASPSSSTFAQNGLRFALATSGAATLLALPMNFHQLNVVRLESDGSISGDTPLVLTDSEIGRVSIAPDDSGHFLVAWQESFILCNLICYDIPMHVRAARITASLANLDPAGITISAELYPREPAVVWNGREWLIVWFADERNGAFTQPVMRGRRLTRDGLFADNDPGVSIAVTRGRALQLVWDGARYVLAWHANASATVTSQWQTHIAWLPRLGAALVGDRALGEPDPYAMPVALVPLERDSVLALYARLAREPELGAVTRAFVNVLSPAIPKRRSAR